jgi:hypothetical protein
VEDTAIDLYSCGTLQNCGTLSATHRNPFLARMVREAFVNDGHDPGRPAWSVAANGVQYAAALALSAHSSADVNPLGFVPDLSMRGVE